jgi:hypothetical protein
LQDEANRFEALMLLGHDADELRRSICDHMVPPEFLFELLRMVSLRRVAVTKGNLSALAGKFDSVEQFWQRCKASLLLPEKKYFNEEFLKQFIGGQKVLIPEAAARRVQLPNIPELDSEALTYWTLHPIVTICLPDPIGKTKKRFDRNYLASVINSVYPGAMDELLNEIVRLRLPAPEPAPANSPMPAALVGAMQSLADIPAGVQSRLARKGLDREKHTLPYLAVHTTPEGVVFAVSNLKNYFGAVSSKDIPAIRTLIANSQHANAPHH